ncbi:28S ribosomal protein S18a, mitochondrial [Cricetulus griseus]|uniref:28S ribosomal protein S18a, mitochondrial n=1 Tax=Cricetulus griseus TaxID=10029 RepID=G3IQA1_CRIGR|nr:28S ribosomal protein S18a, mitochondrial [Cricetulus griseus]
MAALRALVSGCGRQLQGFLAGPAATGWLRLPARGLREGECQGPATTPVCGSLSARL